MIFVFSGFLYLSLYSALGNTLIKQFEDHLNNNRETRYPMVELCENGNVHSFALTENIFKGKK